MSSLTQFLNDLVKFGKKQRPDLDWRYSSFEELILDLGVLHTEARLGVSGPLKQCYQNAFMAAVDNEGWTYVEGYAHSIIPVMHAWCLDETGTVVETTWRTVGTEYYGVPMNLDWVMKRSLATRYWGILPNDHIQDFELLREGLPLEARLVGLTSA